MLLSDFPDVYDCEDSVHFSELFFFSTYYIIWTFSSFLLILDDDVTTAVDIYSFGMCALEVRLLWLTIPRLLLLYNSMYSMNRFVDVCRWHSWKSMGTESPLMFLRTPSTTPYSYWRTRCRRWSICSHLCQYSERTSRIKPDFESCVCV